MVARERRDGRGGRGGRVPRFDRRVVVALVVIMAASVVGHLLVYPHLPDVVPTHWNAAGVVDQRSPKALSLVLDLLPLPMAGLFWLVPRIDPNGGNFEDFWGFYQGFVVVLTVYMCALSWMTDLAALGVIPHEGSGFVGIAVPLGVGLLFVWVGNYLPRVRRNYTFGVRTSWALADERTWQKSQRMGGITFVIMGIALMALGLVSQAMPGEVVFAVLLAVVLGGSGWTMLYSYLVWRGGDR